MSSKEEIKVLFTQEICNTQEYQIALNIKNYIIEQINTPNIQENVVYMFSNPLSKDGQEILKMCLTVLFGFYGIVNENGVVIDMRSFLL